MFQPVSGLYPLQLHCFPDEVTRIGSAAHNIHWLVKISGGRAAYYTDRIEVFVEHGARYECGAGIQANQIPVWSFFHVSYLGTEKSCVAEHRPSRFQHQMDGASALPGIILQPLRDSAPVLLEIKPLFLDGEAAAQIYELKVLKIIGESQRLVYARQQIFQRRDVGSQINVGPG